MTNEELITAMEEYLKTIPQGGTMETYEIIGMKKLIKFAKEKIEGGTKMNKYYCTFGTDKAFPFSIDEFVIVEAPDEAAAYNLFMMVHPNPRPNCENIANFAFCCDEKKWPEVYEKYYKGQEPSEVISVNVSKPHEAATT